MARWSGLVRVETMLNIVKMFGVLGFVTVVMKDINMAKGKG
ncbi:hypothetical protein [Paenibacillus alginolyticus]|nr:MULTISPECIES: hypothetical protein [Paenibacillus]